MTVHYIANYRTQGERHDAFMRLHDDWPCDVEPTENNLRPDGTEIMPTDKGKADGRERKEFPHG